MSSTSLRILLVAVLVLAAFVAVLGSASAQTAAPTATTAVGTATSSGAAGTSATATPRTLPTTGGASSPASTVTIVLLALGATAGLGGLLLRGLRQPQ